VILYNAANKTIVGDNSEGKSRRVPLAACQPVHAGQPSSVHLLILYHPRTRPATDRRRADSAKGLVCVRNSSRVGRFGPPVIVITGHGKDGPELARRVMSEGAVDFVNKPFPSVGDTLDKAIRRALAKQAQRQRLAALGGPPSTVKPEGDPAMFDNGELVFSKTRVEFCGVRICDGAGSSMGRAILDILRNRDSRGKIIALSGEELAQQVGGALTSQNDISDAVRRLRMKIQMVLLEEANIRCGREDVVTNDRKHGYSLSGKVTVRDVDAPNHEPNDRSVADDLSARQQWLLNELAGKGEMQKDEVWHGYKKQFGLSKTSLKRDLSVLRSRNLIRSDGEKRTGRWRVV